MPDFKWFKGAKLSYAEHIFRNQNPDSTAIHFKNENFTRLIKWSELKSQVQSIQYWMKSIGIKEGDRVCSFLPNIPEAVSCFLAANSLGAIWSSCSPDFGVETVIERLAG